MNLEGVFLPVTTPFDSGSGDVDIDAFAANVKAWCDHPIAGLVVGGSTGEAALLDEPVAAPIAGINVAILYGFGLIIAAIILSLIYGVICNREESLETTSTKDSASSEQEGSA